ncbi:hypothetical protein MSAN_00623500 [Mycena sanguinolenta]|uniref:Uncharacterized protein n=1 Tax=Mycena sanguinolenta TaxID=230812 RepID=A0A8H7DC16_9AGAR|nr:hypothetical protein MSAN_00623500 [Mycena sanguinolenta]
MVAAYVRREGGSRPPRVPSSRLVYASPHNQSTKDTHRTANSSGTRHVSMPDFTLWFPSLPGSYFLCRLSFVARVRRWCFPPVRAPAKHQPRKERCPHSSADLAPHACDCASLWRLRENELPTPPHGHSYRFLAPPAHAPVWAVRRGVFNASLHQISVTRLLLIRSLPRRLSASPATLDARRMHISSS